jgi:Prokaryotic phospholipase A2
MDRRSLTRTATASALALTAALAVGTAAAAATGGDKLSVLANWTQPPVSSYNAWYGARLHQASWSSYHFDWSTDYCSDSPDEPLGFNFKLPCARHDFGYRNYTAAGLLGANKPRVDSAFYADLQRDCATYSVFVRPACDSLAWTYYQAVRVFGRIAVSPADLNRAALLKQQGEAQAKAS